MLDRLPKKSLGYHPPYSEPMTATWSSFRNRLAKVPMAQSLMNLGRRARRLLAGPSRGERYDIETIQVLRRVLTAQSVALDVGAHVGEILREIVAIAPASRHQAVEALPHLAERLRADFKSVDVHACAVADKTGQQMFNFVENAPAYSGLRLRQYSRSDPVIRQIPVQVRRIDDLIPVELVIELIKLDIEGGEYHALLGAKETLRRCMPVLIFEYGLGAADYYRVTPEMMYALLEGDLGYHVSSMERWLAGSAPYDLPRFAEAYQTGREFYFIAYPKARAAGQPD